MVLKIHSDASYLSESKDRSRIGGHFFMGNLPDRSPDNNGAILQSSIILRNVVASAAEAEYGALFENMRTSVGIRTTLEELGHGQPPTPVCTDNSTAEGISNKRIKKKKQGYGYEVSLDPRQSISESI